MSAPVALRELKVVIPTRLAVAVHSTKILTGRNIRDVVEDALRQYFARQDEAAAALRLEQDS